MQTGDLQKKKINVKKALELPLLLLFTTVLLCLLCKLSSYILPLILALLLSLLIEPLVRFLAIRKDAHGHIVKPGIPRNLSVIVAMVLVFSILLVLIVLLVNGVTGEVLRLARTLPQTLPQLSESVDGILSQLQQKLNFLSPELLQVAQSTFSRVGEQLMQGVSELATGLITSMTRVPTLLLFLIITVLSTYFLASSRESLLHGMHNQLPTPWVKQFRNMYNTLIRALLGWLRAQALIMCILFMIMAVGFAILHIDYALLLAAGIAFMDALPVFGSGLAFIPWAAYHFFFGSPALGMGLCVLFLLVICARQFIEPRIVGVQIGLPPLLTMGSMYAGLKWMGVIGLLVGPVLVLILLNVTRTYLNGRTYREVVYDTPHLFSHSKKSANI